jgi:CO dehydrogenase maturation factor
VIFYMNPRRLFKYVYNGCARDGEACRMGDLKIAFLGKGGTGKSTVAGTVCRHLGRRGHTVLALDVDTAPGLAISIGVPMDEGRLPSRLAELVEGKKGRHWKMVKGAGPARLVDRFSVHGVDGIRFLELGKLPDRVEPSVSVAFRSVMERFRRPGWTMVADLAAGTRQPMFGWADFAGVRVVVVEPSSKATLTARRLTAVATHMVVNKVRSRSDLEIVTNAVPLPLLGVIPYDEDIGEAERQGIAPIDFSARSPAVQAAADLATHLEELA